MSNFHNDESSEIRNRLFTGCPILENSKVTFQPQNNAYPLVSIVVPVYNTASYISRCLDSIIFQSYTNIEILVVNDGSTDDSGRICSDYAAKDSRVKLISKKNGGVISARREGVKIASAPYVAFVDADDYVDKNFCTLLLKGMLENNADISICNLTRVSPGNQYKKVKGYDKGVYSTQFLMDNIIDLTDFYHPKMPPEIYTALYRKDIAYNVLCHIDDKICYGEGYMYLMLYFLKSAKVYMTDEYLYFYVQNRNSITNSLHKSYIKSIELMYRSLRKEFLLRISNTKMFEQLTNITVMLFLLGGGYEKDILPTGSYLFPFKNVPVGSDVSIYGFGKFGRALAGYLSCPQSKYRLIHVVDINSKNIQYDGFTIETPDILLKSDYDFLLICVLRNSIANDIKKSLVSKGVPEYKIQCLSQELITDDVIPAEWKTFPATVSMPSKER